MCDWECQDCHFINSELRRDGGCFRCGSQAVTQNYTPTQDVVKTPSVRLLARQLLSSYYTRRLQEMRA